MLLTLMAFCLVLAHSVGGENMPRFLAFAKLSILRHVAHANGVLLRTCSLCKGGMSCRFAYGILVGCISL